MYSPQYDLNSRGPIRLWNLPCVAIKLFVQHGMRQDTLRAYLQGCCCELCSANLEDAQWVLRMTHEACHSANPLSNRIEAQLHVRFRDQIQFVRGASYLAIARRLAESGVTEFELVGLLWALHTDTSAGKQRFGKNLLAAMVREESQSPPPNIIPWPGLRRDAAGAGEAHRWN